MANAKLGYWFDKYIFLPLATIAVIATVAMALWLHIERSNEAHHELATSWDVLVDGHANLQQGIIPDHLTALAKAEEMTLFGYIYPLETAEEHQRFLLISHSASCPFHQLSGQGNVVEVIARHPITHTYAPILISGRFHIDEQVGADIQYRLDDAVLVTP